MGFGDLTLQNSVGSLLNINSPETLFSFLWSLFYSIGLGLGMIFFLVGAIKIITSAGDQGKLEEGKQALLYSTIGIVVVIAFTVILNFFFRLLGIGVVENYLNENPGTSIIVLQEGDYAAAKSGAALTYMGDGFTVLMFLLRNLILALALMFILVAGIKFSTSVGDAEKVNSAKQTLTWAIVGAILSVIFYVVLYFFANLVGINGISPTGGIDYIPPNFFGTAP